MIGDTPDDMRAARGAGVVPIGVVAPSDDRERMGRRLVENGGARVLQCLAELEEMLP
jgi:phosphoglycolate phosphatase-like HAD superfamily hydrolase